MDKIKYVKSQTMDSNMIKPQRGANKEDKKDSVHREDYIQKALHISEKDYEPLQRNCRSLKFVVYTYKIR